MKSSENQEDWDKPPFMKEWKNLYLFIVGWLILMISVFHFFSQSFS